MTGWMNALSAVILTRRASVAESWVLFGFKSQGGQTRTARVPVDPIGCSGWGSIWTGRRTHGGVNGGPTECVQVADGVHAGGHAHTHRRDRARGRKDGLGRQRAHGVKKREVFRGQTLVCPVVVSVGGVHVLIGLNQTTELRQVPIFA